MLGLNSSILPHKDAWVGYKFHSVAKICDEIKRESPSLSIAVRLGASGGLAFTVFKRRQFQKVLPSDDTYWVPHLG